MHEMHARARFHASGPLFWVIQTMVFRHTFWGAKTVPENHVFWTRKPPSGRWFFGPCFGVPPGTPKKWSRNPPKHGPETPVSDPCFGTENRLQNHGFRAQNHGFGLRNPCFGSKQLEKCSQTPQNMGRTPCFGQIAGRKALIARGFFGIPPKQPKTMVLGSKPWFSGSKPWFPG